MEFKKKSMAAAMGVILSLAGGVATVEASSHREAPFITEMPKVDGTDFYMFRSYESGRDDYVTIIANYHPLQDAYGGPNYFTMDPDALYEIHVDSDGDAQEDITFQFRFGIDQQDVELDIGGELVAVPLINTGAITANDESQLSRKESYTLDIVRGDRRSGVSQSITQAVSGADQFTKPVDYIGTKSLPDYENYANQFIYDISIPGCDNGRVFVGQRRESFAVNLGEIFDLVNTDPLGAPNAKQSTIADKNITSIALEVPRSCLATNGNVIGAWTTSSLRQARVLNPSPSQDKVGASLEGGAWTQVSRLGSPLVNEVVIGINDKDRFNASEPVNDGDASIGFGTYVTNPTLPALLEILFPVTAPTAFPRNDLVAAFLTGVSGLNQPVNVVAAEMLRLNVDTPVVDASSQNTLGVIGGDNAGFPNGRRPGDDVVDIALRVVMGVLLPVADAPSGQLLYTDGVAIDATMFGNSFPYLNAPLPGAQSN